MQTYLANIRGWLYRLLNLNLDFILVLNVLDGNIDKFPPIFVVFLENYACFLIQAKTFLNCNINILIWSEF